MAIILQVDRKFPGVFVDTHAMSQPDSPPVRACMSSGRCSNWIVFFLLLLLAVVQAGAAEARRYRLTLEFSDPAYRWSGIVAYREDFHLILDRAPLGEGYWGSVAGVIYAKNGELHASLKICKLRGKNETDGVCLGEVKYVALPTDRSVAIPLDTKDFKGCKATFTPVK